MEKFSTLKIFEVEIVEAAGMVEVVKATVSKKTTRRRDCRAKQIGVEEDVFKGAVKDTIPTSNASNVRNMVTMQIIVTPTDVIIVAEWVTVPEIVEPKRWKKPSI